MEKDNTFHLGTRTPTSIRMNDEANMMPVPETSAQPFHCEYFGEGRRQEPVSRGLDKQKRIAHI
jgi:hypothetical protein